MAMDSKYCGHIQANDNARVHLGDNYYYGDRERLKHVPGAPFNAYGVDHRACHPATRRELLREIQEWAEHAMGKSIFWLNGMAGTGKSTIAYTVAEWLDQQGASTRATLGASFFFKRGERDQASAALFFPTIVRQLSQKMPGLAVHVDQATDVDPDICNKSLGEQFDKLLDQPLRKLGDSLSQPVYIVVVDALDECQKEEDVRTLLQLCSHLSQAHLCIRWFLTSRPELPIQLGFSRMSADTRRYMVLHGVPPPTIERDIAIFLADAFSQIKNDYNFVPQSGVYLPEDWPGATVLKELTEIAMPLFIIAATICRFVQDQDFDPQDQLDVILRTRRTGHISHIGRTYLPILERVVSSSANRTTQNQIYHDFRLIVGAIVTVAEPLSCLDLSMLLKLSPATVALRLRPLHSVLQVPSQVEAPIRPLHLSFGEFLSSDEIRNQPFYIDRAVTHGGILTKCLELLSASLSENMCQLSYPGHLRTDLAHTIIQDRLSPATQYACRYWTYHARYRGLRIYDNDIVHEFLRKHLLHWLEALSLLDCLADAIRHVEVLRLLVSLTNSNHITAFLEDARRFILANRYVASVAPLQLYSSAILFTPRDSIVRNLYSEVPSWIRQCPITPRTWSSELQILEGHTSSVNAVAFSADQSQLASASDDQTVRLWDLKTGQEIQKLEGHNDSVNSVAFSADGSQLASASSDQTVRLWDTKTGQEIQKLEGHWAGVLAVTFSSDSSQLASASGDRILRLWDAKTGQEIQKLEGHTSWVNAVTFSADGSQLASASDDQTVRLWDAKTGQEIQKLEGHTESANSVTFSADDSQLASASDDQTVRLWDVKTGQEIQKLEGHSGRVLAVTFSADGSQLASASNDRTVRLWDAKMGQEIQKLEGHTGSVNTVAFSADQSQLASASDDQTVRLWDTKTGQEIQKPGGHINSVNAVTFSADGSQLASISSDWTVRLWDTKTGQEIQKLEGHTGSVNAMTFSADGSQLASASDDQTVRLWDARMGQEIQKLEGHWARVNAVTFSADDSQLASASNDKTVRLWDAKTGQEIQKLEGHTGWVNTVAFSADGSQLASASRDWTVRLWDTISGRQIQVLVKGPFINKISFTKDSENGASHIIVVKDDWIEYGNKRHLWLPREYRSRVSAVYGDLLAIGRSSGLVTFIRLQPM